MRTLFLALLASLSLTSDVDASETLVPDWKSARIETTSGDSVEIVAAPGSATISATFGNKTIKVDGRFSVEDTLVPGSVELLSQPRTLPDETKEVRLVVRFKVYRETSGEQFPKYTMRYEFSPTMGFCAYWLLDEKGQEVLVEERCGKSE